MEKLLEGLQYKDMVGIIKPTMFVDEFQSKIGGDDEIAVLSFYVMNSQVADDLVNWFEKGYDFVIDADRSPGEVKTNRFMVYVEIARRTRLIGQMKELLEDLATLTEFELTDWIITCNEKEMNFDAEALVDILDLSPHVYRANHDEELNEMRMIAHLPIPKIKIKRDPELDKMRMRAGLDI